MQAWTDSQYAKEMEDKEEDKEEEEAEEDGEGSVKRMSVNLR